MVNDVDGVSTPTDDTPTADQEQALLDAVMANSPIMDEVGIPLPDEVEEEVQDPVETDEEDPESEEVVSEDEEEEEEVEVEEDEDEDAAEEVATQEADVFTTEDLDLDAKLKVKVDGEEMEVSFGDLVKGYQTDAHLSKQGRELGEARKALETEREEKLAELNTVSEATSQLLQGAENNFAKQYHAIEEQIEKARKDGDTYEVNELKDKREQIQKNYWGARNRRDALMKSVEEHNQKLAQEAWQQQIEHFQEKIPELIPDFSEEVAKDIRQFALDEGINPDILDQITDPIIVKIVDDYRRLKQNVSKGEVKRKAAPAKRVPAKKSTPAKKKKEDADKMMKARAFREDASEDDQMNFLRDYASKSLNL